MASTSLHNFQPKVVFIKRKSNQGFGFTLRHFIAYPPEIWNSPDMPQIKAMETIFIKEVHLNGPAYLAGLQTGDRLLTVNDEPIAGVPYSVIVSRIKQTPYILKLEVVSKECDVLQMYYTDIAHNPESNRFRDKNKLALLNYVPSSSNSSGSSNLNAINRKTLSFPTTTIPLATAFNNVNLQQQQQQPAMIQQQQQQQPNQLTKLSSNTNFFPETRAKLKFSEKFSAFGESNFNFSTIPSTTTTTFSGSNNSNSNSCDFMARLRKSIEQKEEFLNKVSAPQNYTNSFFKTFKSSDNPKRMISSGDKVNNIYALTSMGFSQNPKGEDDEDNDKRFQLIAGGGGGIEKGEIGAVALPLPAPPKVITSTTIKDVHYDEQNLYGGIKKDGKLNKVTERYKPVSPITLGIPPNEPISLCKIPTSMFDKCERKLEMKTTNMQNKSIVKVGTLETSEKSNSLEYKENDLDSMKSEDCITSLQNPSQVLRRCRASTLNDDNKLMRRISYLRATNNEDGFHIETNHPELMNFEEKLEICDKENECKAINDLQSNAITSTKSENNTESITSEMEIKSSSIFGKRLTEYRSWKHVKIELKGETLKIITGRNKSDTNIIELNLKNYEISEDISSRRKYVFKLQSITNAQKINIKTNTNDIQQQQQIKSDCSSSSNSTANNNIQFTEIYFKVENLNEMKKWIELIKSRITSKKGTTTSSQSSSENNGKQLAEPQKTAAISSVSTSEYPDDTSNEFKKSLTISPISICSTTTNTVTTTTESKDNETDTSNSVCSPVIKTRKSEKSDKDLGSPKSKNWRDLLFRKGGSSSGGGGGSSGSGSSSGSSLQMGGACRTGGSIGFPLKSCPMSKDNEYVPCIVDVCTKIVESKGLNVVGIYRIPGNKAAISELKDQVNRNDFQWDQINDDIRWDDVNVVSSLLKLFIRSLPDGLLPCTFYINFIESDKCNKGEKKLKEIKYLLNQLPVYSYETLKHIIQHLHRISKNCDVNLMEPKNLAIIFGPSIIRTPNETLEIAVKDMKHQCCIVELLVSQYEYFFESGAFPTLENNSSSIATSITTQHQQEQQTLLLGNVQKIERKYHTDKDKESVASRFIPHLRRRSQSKRSTINSDTYSGESILSLECKKLNNDQCENSEHGSKEEGGSLEISISLTDEESSNSQISDSGSMSLTTITDTLDSKLRNLRSTSESQSQSDENDSPNKQQQQQQQQQQQIQKNNTPRRDTSNTQQQQIQQQSQPLILHENIPFVDDSPEIPSTSIISDNNCSSSISNTKNVKCSTSIGTNDNVFVRTTSSNLYNNSSNRDNLLSKNHSSHHHHQQHHHHNHHSSTISKLSSSSNLHNYSHKFIGSGKGGGISCSSDDSDHDDSDSEVSTTSDPKESILISPLIFEQRYKKRNNNNNKNNSNGNGSSSSGTNGNYNKLFRSASFNCRNYSATNKYGNNTSTPTTSATTTTNQIPITSTISSNLTKDEKTDMNYTKKRQIQNKQNRSIKRRHTVGGPSDYSATITRRTDNDHVLEVGIRIKNLNRRKNMN